MNTEEPTQHPPPPDINEALAAITTASTNSSNAARIEQANAMVSAVVRTAMETMRDSAHQFAQVEIPRMGQLAEMSGIVSKLQDEASDLQTKLDAAEREPKGEDKDEMIKALHAEAGFMAAELEKRRNIIEAFCLDAGSNTRLTRALSVLLGMEVVEEDWASFSMAQIRAEIASYAKTGQGSVISASVLLTAQTRIAQADEEQSEDGDGG